MSKQLNEFFFVLLDEKTSMWLCECAARHPSVAQLLRALQAHTVCTGAQCFESTADLTGAVVHVSPQTSAIVRMATALLLVALCVAVLPPPPVKVVR
jgi:hypothetical protein